MLVFYRCSLLQGDRQVINEEVGDAVPKKRLYISDVLGRICSDLYMHDVHV